MTASNGNDKRMQVRLEILFILVLVLLFTTVSCAKKKISSGAPGDGDSVSATSDEAFELAKQRELERRKAIEEGRLSETQGEQGMIEGEAGTGAASEMEQFVNEVINFEYDSSFLTPTAQEILHRKADWLQANPDANVIIQGHTDERGTVEYNLALGDRRANSTKNFLVDMGIDTARITTVSFGEERPIDPMNTEDAWAQNRRAEFVLEQ